MLGEVPHFLLREQVGNPHFFHKSSIAAHGKRKTTRGLPINRGFGQWIRVGWPSLGRCLGGGRFSKRDETYTEIDGTNQRLCSCNLAKTSSVFFLLQLFDLKLHT